jgi:hypothetical protein
MWDLRVKKNVGQIYGPNICGDAIDSLEDGSIITGAWRGRD